MPEVGPRNPGMQVPRTALSRARGECRRERRTPPAKRFRAYNFARKIRTFRVFLVKTMPRDNRV